jgi:hypothetical protein
MPSAALHFLTPRSAAFAVRRVSAFPMSVLLQGEPLDLGGSMYRAELGWAFEWFLELPVPRSHGAG